jgi:hypothetical protein
MSRAGETEQSGQERPEEFVPRGAIAFMVLMVIAYAATWLFFYSIMVGRP